MNAVAQRVLTAVVTLLAVLALSPVTAGADDVLTLTPTELVVIDRSLDGSRVRVTGEAIGEDLHADGDHRWVNILADGTAVGVFVSNDSADQIDVYGDHTHRGDTIEVVGTVNVACDEHGGEFDIHAEEFTVVAEGGTIDRPVAPWKGIVGVLAAVVAFIEMRVLGRVRERHLLV